MVWRDKSRNAEWHEKEHRWSSLERRSDRPLEGKAAKILRLNRLNASSTALDLPPSVGGGNEERYYYSSGWKLAHSEELGDECQWSQPVSHQLQRLKVAALLLRSCENFYHREESYSCVDRIADTRWHSRNEQID